MISNWTVDWKLKHLTVGTRRSTMRNVIVAFRCYCFLFKGSFGPFVKSISLILPFCEISSNQVSFYEWKMSLIVYLDVNHPSVFVISFLWGHIFLKETIRSVMTYCISGHTGVGTPLWDLYKWALLSPSPSSSGSPPSLLLVPQSYA